MIFAPCSTLSRSPRFWVLRILFSSFSWSQFPICEAWRSSGIALVCSNFFRRPQKLMHTNKFWVISLNLPSTICFFHQRTHHHASSHSNNSNECILFFLSAGSKSTDYPIVDTSGNHRGDVFGTSPVQAQISSIIQGGSTRRNGDLAAVMVGSGSDRPKRSSNSTISRSKYPLEVSKFSSWQMSRS